MIYFSESICHYFLWSIVNSLWCLIHYSETVWLSIKVISSLECPKVLISSQSVGIYIHAHIPGDKYGISQHQGRIKHLDAWQNEVSIMFAWFRPLNPVGGYTQINGANSSNDCTYLFHLSALRHMGETSRDKTKCSWRSITCLPDSNLNNKVGAHPYCSLLHR